MKKRRRAIVCAALLLCSSQRWAQLTVTAVLAQRQRKAPHPVARLIWFSGPSEGWASYAEHFAREIGLYDSDFEIIGRVMSSVTPPMVADLGMQAMGWSRGRSHCVPQ